MGVYVYPRYGAQTPDTGQRWIGGFGYGPAGDLGCASAGPAMSLGSYRPRDPAGGWVEMTQIMPVRAGTLDGYGTAMSFPKPGDPGYEAWQKYQTEAKAEHAAARSARAEDLGVTNLHIEQAKQAVALANGKAQALAAPGAAHRADRAQAILEAKVEKDRAAQMLVVAREQQLATRHGLHDRALAALARAIVVTEQRLANARAGGDPAAVAHLTRLVGHLKALQHRFARSRAHVAGLHQKIRAMTSAVAEADTGPVRFHADSRGMVGPSIPLPAAPPVVAAKSPMAAAAEVVAGPVVAGYAGYGELDAGADAARLEGDAVQAAEALPGAVESGADPTPALAAADQALGQAERLQAVERTQPLVPGATGPGGAMLMWGVAAALGLFLLMRR